MTRFYSEKPFVVLMEDGTTQTLRVVLYENGVFHMGQSTQPTTLPATLPATEPAVEPPAATLPTTAPATMPASAPPAGTTRSLRPSEFGRMVTAEARWNGSVSAGASLYRGNTSSETLTLAFDASRRSLHDRVESSGVYNYGREKNPDDGEKFVTTNNWSVSSEYDYFITRQQYLYAGGRIEQDRMQDLYLRATPGAGVGHQWIESDRTNINTEAGLAWVYERRTDPHDIDQYVALRLAWHVDRKLNDRVSLVHNFEILPRIDDFSDYVMNADGGVRVGITSHLFTTFRVVLTYDSTPGEGDGATDVSYNALVGYQF